MMGRLAAALALLVALSSAAGAETIRNVDPFVYGDNITPLTVTLDTGAGRYDLTGKSVALVARTTIAGRSYDLRIVGEMVTPTSGVCRFRSIGTRARNPGSRVRDAYFARVVVIAGSDSGFTSPITFSVTRALP